MFLCTFLYNSRTGSPAVVETANGTVYDALINYNLDDNTQPCL